MWQRRDIFSASIAVGVLCAITLGVYGQLLNYDFIGYDDPFFIAQNPHVTGGLTMDNILWSFSSSRMGIWHPLTWMSYQLEISVFGQEIPAVHHATNVVFHLINTILVFILCMRLSGTVWASLLVAILFSIHPQHVQPVAWISERKEVMAAAFFLISLNLYIGSLNSQRKKLLYMTSLLAFAVALLCKPSVAPLPVILVLVDVFYGGTRAADGRPVLSFSLPDRSGAPGLLRNKVPFLILAVIVSVITIYIKKTGSWASFEDTLHLGRRILLMPIGFLHYVKSLFVPWPNPMWIDAPDGLPYIRSLLSTGFLSVMACFIWILRSRFPELLFGALWFFLMWLPVSGIVLVSNYYVADRYTYLSYIGAFFGIVFFARRMLCTGPGRYRWCLLAALTLVLVSAALAHKQAGYWRDTITFFERESQINPNSPSAPIHVGQALLEQGKAGEALKQFERSLELDSGKAKAHALKADALRELGRVEEAVPIYRYAIEKMVDRADVYVQLGILLLNRGDNEGAVAVMGDGLNRYPEDVYLLNHMAHNFGFTQGRVELSRDYYGRALGEDPDNVHALLGLGILDLRENKLKEGIDKLERVLELDPENEPAHDAIRTYYRK